VSKSLTLFSIGVIVCYIAGIFLLRLLLAPFFAPPASYTQVVLRPERTYTMLFVGDIMLDRLVAKRVARAQDPLLPFLLIAHKLRSADIAFANLEGPVSDRGVNQGSKYSFRFEPVGTINALTFAGFDVISLANNHIWDWGTSALLDTLTHLRGAGIETIGAGANKEEANQPAIVALGDARVGFLGYTTLYPKSLEATTARAGVSSPQLSSITAQIADLKTNQHADLVVVSLHWGIEYEQHSTTSQQLFARALIDAGADLVVGHHPHVVQEVEEYKGRYIAYSLGNFVFDQDFSLETMRGLMLEVSVRNKQIEAVREIPIELTSIYQPRIVE
jgi:poly-gamma-glutamate synthesis protein (capsule biosynthesis protein)